MVPNRMAVLATWAISRRFILKNGSSQEARGCFSVGIECEHRELAIPFWRELAELFEPDAAGQAAFNSGFHQRGGKEGEGQRQVDVTEATMLTARDRFRIRNGAIDKFVEPTPATGNRRDSVAPRSSFIGRSGSLADVGRRTDHARFDGGLVQGMTMGDLLSVASSGLGLSFTARRRC